MTVAPAAPAAPHDLAFPGVGSLAADAFDGAMKAVWDFAGKLLTTAFDWIDKFATPDLNPATGPFGGVLPTVTWVAGCVVALLVFVQIGWGAITRGVGLAKLLIGAGQYVLVTAAGYAVLAAALTAASGLTAGILKQGLGVDNWAGINGTHNNIFVTANQALTGVQLGMVAISCVIPTAIGYLVEALVRSASLLILAATMPILAAGLVSEKTSTWFWKGLRWTTALLMLQPATALVITIGFRVASGASGGTAGSGDTAQGLGQLVVAGLMMLISLLCPLALFKLLAFVDPSTPSGAAVHGAMPSAGGRSGSGSAQKDGGAAGKGGAGQAAGEGATTGRFAAALSKAGPEAAAVYTGFKAAQGLTQQTLGHAGNVLGAVGAGHHGMAGSTIPGGGGATGRNQGSTAQPTSSQTTAQPPPSTPTSARAASDPAVPVDGAAPPPQPADATPPTPTPADAAPPPPTPGEATSAQPVPLPSVADTARVRPAPSQRSSAAVRPVLPSSAPASPVAEQPTTDREESR